MTEFGRINVFYSYALTTASGRAASQPTTAVTTVCSLSRRCGAASTSRWTVSLKRRVRSARVGSGRLPSEQSTRGARTRCREESAIGHKRVSQLYYGILCPHDFHDPLSRAVPRLVLGSS